MLGIFRGHKRAFISVFVFCFIAFGVYFVQYIELYPSLSINTPFHQFHVVNSSNLLQPHPHIFHNTITVIPINSGMLHLVKNMLCSLARIDPVIPTRITIWAMNEEVVEELHAWNMKNEAIYNITTYLPQQTHLSTSDINDMIVNATKNHTLLPIHGFSVFYDTNYTGVKEAKDGWTPEYAHMMLMRRSLYADILQNINLLFMDGDMVFLDDPYRDMGITDDFSYYRDYASDENFTIADENFLPPDFVYATDPRDGYKWLDDPYEGFPYVPMICGCLFFARANNRTARIMEDLANSTWNDQYGMDMLFNTNEGRCTILSEPLPPYLPRKNIDRSDCDMENRLRVRILDPAKYANGVLFLKLKEHYHELLGELMVKGEKRVMVHPNVWESGFDKVKALKDEGFWFLDEEEMCKSH